MLRPTSRPCSISTGGPGWTGSTSISIGCRPCSGPTSSSSGARSASASRILRRSCTARRRFVPRISAIRRAFSARRLRRRKRMPSKLPDVGTTIFTVMSRRARELGALNLGQGFPDYDIHPRLADLTGAAMRQGHNQYAPMEGVPELRERIAGKLAASYGGDFDPQSQITITLGATEAIYSAVQAVVGPGEEAIAFDPAYDSYEPAVRLAGGRCIRLPLLPPDFRYDWDRVRSAVTPRTRLVLFNTPHNPACTAATAADLAELAGIIRGRDIVVLSDEVYEHVLFDGRAHASVLSHPELRQRSFAVFSFGKTLHATGLRVGY